MSDDVGGLSGNLVLDLDDEFSEDNGSDRSIQDPKKYRFGGKKKDNIWSMFTEITITSDGSQKVIQKCKECGNIVSGKATD